MKNTLAIVLITYNRAEHLERTLRAILAPDSPVRDCDVTVLNNRSTDETAAVVDRFAAAHANVRQVVHNFNVGGNANIAKALERCATPYHWVLCDDDVYDWEGWDAVAAAMARGEKLLCVGDRHLPKTEPARSDPAQLLQQMTFLPSIVYGPGVVTDVALRNAYDNTYALFPHLAPVILHLNAGGKIWVAPRPLVRPGEFGTDISYTRGYRRDDIFPDSRTMTLSAGFAHILDGLADRRLAKAAFRALTFGSQMGRLGFYGEVFARLRGRAGAANFAAILRQSSWGMRVVLRVLRLVQSTPLYDLLMSESFYRAVRRVTDARNAKARAKL